MNDGTDRNKLMEIATVWVRYEGDEWDEAPQLVEAWTEFDIDNNWDGWVKARDEAVNASEVRDWRIVNLTLPYDRIADLFREATIEVDGVTLDGIPRKEQSNG